MEAHIRDVKEAAHQLNYNDDAVLHFIKAIMPSEIYGTLYNQNYLNMVITMVKDIHAKKPKPVSLSTATAAAAPSYTYSYGGAEKPQLATATALPQAYEEALTTMWQSLKNQDPLHGLNM